MVASGRGQGAEDAPEMTIGANSKSPATKLKLDLGMLVRDVAERRAGGCPIRAGYRPPLPLFRRRAFLPWTAPAPGAFTACGASPQNYASFA